MLTHETFILKVGTEKSDKIHESQQPQNGGLRAMVRPYRRSCFSLWLDLWGIILGAHWRLQRFGAASPSHGRVDARIIVTAALASQLFEIFEHFAFIDPFGTRVSVGEGYLCIRLLCDVIAISPNVSLLTVNTAFADSNRSERPACLARCHCFSGVAVVRCPLSMVFTLFPPPRPSHYFHRRAVFDDCCGDNAYHHKDDCLFFDTLQRWNPRRNNHARTSFANGWIFCERGPT